METITATLYKRPHGRQEEIAVTNVRPDAAKYINENNIRVSMEDCGLLGNVVYFDTGLFLDDEETPDEITVIAGKKSCEEVMDHGVELVKKARLQATEQSGN